MNLTNYFERIKLKNTPDVSERSLYELQSSQITNIPFENIDCFLHREIHLDIENLQAKLFTNLRGGYCFELNQIFHYALSALDFNSRPLLARVMYRGTEINSRTHIILLVEIDGRQYIADAGFGGPGAFLPIPFEIDREDSQANGVFRISRDPTHSYIMKKKTETGWYNVYAFNLAPVYPADLVMSNFFTSQFPDSHFRKNLIVSLSRPDGKTTLLNRQLSTTTNATTSTQDITTEKELLSVLKEKFGIVKTGFDFSRLF